MSRRGVALAVAASVVAIDQATKLLAHARLRGHGPLEIVPGFFNLWYSTNRGGLFGYFGNAAEPWRSLLLILLPAVAIVVIVSLLWRDREADFASRLGLSLILGGAVGNLIDRLLRGSVIDFLDVHAGSTALAERLVGWFGTSHWPTFNAADSAIVVGAGLMLFRAFCPPAAAGDPQREPCSRS